MTTAADRTLDSQRIIREMAGLLSTFGHHARHHPEECIPEAEALYDAFFAAQAREIEQLRRVLETVSDLMQIAGVAMRNAHAVIAEKNTDDRTLGEVIGDD